MCGVAGIIHSSREHPVDEAVLDRMTDILKHRGPDDRGTQIWGNIGFGHRRLSIIDLETGRQPMCNADGTLWITYNGELYNYVELRQDLTGSGFQFRTHSDTEVILNLYARHGLEMFQHMNGMFAFALLDTARGRILLARDRFGEKPLYYLKDSGRFAFASEIKALLTLPGVKPEADPGALHEYLTFQYCLHDRTLFEGIRRLKPATYLLLDGAGGILQEKEYWSLGFEEDHSRSEESYLEELRSLLEDSVKIRLRSDVPVGTYLSGGIDSSLVATLARNLQGRGLPAFTGYFEDGDRYSELKYAKAVAEGNGSPHHVICPSPQDFEVNFRRIIHHMDEPAAGPGSFPQLMVSELAVKQVKVVLGGQGGDEIFGGYARYLILYLEECIRGSIFETQDSKRHIVTLDHVPKRLAMLRQYVPMLKDFWSGGLFEPVERRYYSLISRAPAPEKYFATDFLRSLNEDDLYQAFERQFNDILHKVPSGGSALLNRMTAYDARTMLQSLLHVEDRMSMAVSLESRLPLLDHRITELMFRMPPRFKYRDGQAKSALLSAVGDLLPDLVRNRKDKMGFPVPFVEWARGPLRSWVHEILLGRAARERGIYRPDGIQSLLQSERPFGRELWGLLSLETWFQTFVDGFPRGAGPIPTA